MRAVFAFNQARRARSEAPYRCSLVQGFKARKIVPGNSPHEPQDSAQSFEGHRDFKFRVPLCPPKLCAETLARRTDSMVHGPNVRPKLEVEASHEPGSAGTLAGVLPVERFAGKGAGAPRNGSLVQGFKARSFSSGNSHPGLLPKEKENRSPSHRNSCDWIWRTIIRKNQTRANAVPSSRKAGSG